MTIAPRPLNGWRIDIANIDPREVRTTVTEDDDSVTWNLRIWDPNTSDHFPDDFTTGVLPPNDPETHCGEGHITYRVKLKENAASGSVVKASASIVFDYNDPIETDPAWWNTVTSIGEFLKAGEYFKATLVELGYDVPTDGTPYDVKALGRPAGLKGTYNGVVYATGGTPVVPVNGQDARSTSGLATITVSSAGKISGRGRDWSIGIL